MIVADQRLNELLRGVDLSGSDAVPYRLSQMAGGNKMAATADGHEFLSLEAMKGEAGWEAALNWPLPPDAGFSLLDEARRHIIAYLDWVTHDLARGPSPSVLWREIELAARRLFEISMALHAVLDSRI